MEKTLYFPYGGRARRKEAKVVLLCGQRTTLGTNEVGKFRFLGSVLPSGRFIPILEPVTLGAGCGWSPSDPSLSHLLSVGFCPKT